MAPHLPCCVDVHVDVIVAPRCLAFAPVGLSRSEGWGAWTAEKLLIVFLASDVADLWPEL